MLWRDPTALIFMSCVYAFVLHAVASATVRVEEAHFTSPYSYEEELAQRHHTVNIKVFFFSVLLIGLRWHVLAYFCFVVLFCFVLFDESFIFSEFAIELSTTTHGI